MSFYGSIAGVAAYVRHMTFDDPSNPTSADIIQFLTQQSAVLDGWMAREGYTVPVASTYTEAYSVLGGFANLGAAGLAELTQRSAGYSSEGDDAREQAFLGQFKNAQAYIASGALAALGVSQARTPRGLFGLAIGGRTNSGAYLRPIFSRTSFGNNPTLESGEGEP